MGLTLGYLCFLLVIMYVTNLFTGFVCHATAGGLARNAMLFVKKAQSPSFNKFSKAWNAQSRDKKKCVSATQVDDGWMCMHTYIWLISALATRWPPNMSMLSFARLASRPSSCWMTQQVTAATEWPQDILKRKQNKQMPRHASFATILAHPVFAPQVFGMSSESNMSSLVLSHLRSGHSMQHDGSLICRFAMRSAAIATLDTLWPKLDSSLSTSRQITW